MSKKWAFVVIFLLLPCRWIGAEEVVLSTIVGDDSGGQHSLDASDGSPANAVYVDSVGNVGIGTTNPPSKLTLQYNQADGSPTFGTTTGAIHIDPQGNQSSITFGANDAWSGELAQAGIYATANGTYGSRLYFATTNSYATGAQTRMFIQNNGNVGIGTTNPGTILHLYNAAANAEISLDAPADNTRASAIVHKRGGLQRWWVGSNNNVGADDYAWYRYNNLGGFLGTAMTILRASGNVGIGTTTDPTRLLDVNGETRLMKGTNPINFTDAWEGTPDSPTNVAEISNDTGGFRALMIVGNRSRDYGGGSRFRTVAMWDKVGIGHPDPGSYTLYVNGPLAVNSATANKTGGNTWGSLSDIRLKEITGGFGYGLQEILKLEPVRYHYKTNPELGLSSDEEHVGFSAQQVREIIPEAVRENEKGYLVVEADPILWAMLNAIKEQNRRIEELEKKLTEHGLSSN
ncbi:MAG: tail fiber domain-containing protein [Candidatus Omnitrophica bacterium]|nr:tail fiber domain-containing protein [Candidatus Omnitrophota bacterium]